jgi:hypothetical protein
MTGGPGQGHSMHAFGDAFVEATGKLADLAVEVVDAPLKIFNKGKSVLGKDGGGGPGPTMS